MQKMQEQFSVTLLVMRDFSGLPVRQELAWAFAIRLRFLGLTLPYLRCD